jgi:hypothetical protein
LNQTTIQPTQSHEHVHFGDAIAPKDNKTVRLYLRNINGTKLANELDWENAMQYLKENTIDLVGITETRVDWNDHNFNKVKTKLNRHFAYNSLTTSNMPSSGSQQGGTASMILSPLVTRKSTTLRDNSGLG